MKNDETITRWFLWSNWTPEKMEAWVEEKAAEGWTLVKVDRGLVRFHFVRTKPHKVRVCADFPADPNGEYMTIFEDAGWHLVRGGLGWHIWQMEYSGTARPEAFTDLDSLIDRNNRTAIILAAGLIGPIAALGLLGTRGVFDSPAGKVWMIIIIALVIFLAAAVGATLRTVITLRERKKLTSD